jgi:hypothetical protein
VPHKGAPHEANYRRRLDEAILEATLSACSVVLPLGGWELADTRELVDRRLPV